MELITLKTPSMEGKIYVGEDVFETRLPFLTQGQKNFVVADENVYTAYPDFFEKYFKDAEMYIFPSGEEYKNFQSLYDILCKMTGAGMHRTSRLFAVGGGVVGDIGGLAAALYMRGISCVQIPTTLLSQVDSSVGGKTAVDLKAGKNLMGAFFQPTLVICDINTLSTLPKEEFANGMAEVIKYGVIFDKDLFDKVKSGDVKSDMENIIARCIELKRDVVAKDELKKAVSEFKGTVILVSHEPEFYQGVVDEVINLENVSNKLI